ncbi:polyketide synthase [Seiridium cupressi]
MAACRDRQKVRLYLVGDSTFPLASGLLSLLRQGYNPLLQTFFDATYCVLRAEIASLSSIQRDLFPRFSSIQDLLALHRRGTLHPALHHALVCCFQLALFISRCGEQDDVFSQRADSYLVGLCTGALTTAAVVASRNVSDFLRIAPHTVGIAFRVTLRAYEVARSLKNDSTEPWSIIVANVNEEEVGTLVDEFSKENLLPATSRPYLSFVARDCVTISGPPSIIRALKETKLASFCAVDLDLHVPYHAPHLFTLEDVDAVLSTTITGNWSQYTSHLPVISSATGKISPARDYPGLLQSAVQDILMHPIVWEDVTNGVAYVARFSSEAALSVCGVATARDTHMKNALKQHGFTLEISSLPFAPSSYVPETSVRERSTGAFGSASGKSKIAIVGMSGRFPEAEDPEAFWDLLFQGLDVHKVVPPSRWNVATHVDTSGKRKNTSRTPYGCWLKNPGLFDAKFFNVTPREAPQMDPASRLALMTVYEAMENAGMVPGTTPSTLNDRVGVAFGVSANDWMEVNSAQNIDTFFIPGGCRAFVPGRINYFFKFTGPSLSLDTACSSSLAAIHTACNALWQGDIDTAIAGGSNVLTNPDYTAGLDRGHFLSRTGNCKSFDQAADGYCRADATCAVILKRLDDAIAEKDPILGVILAAGTNHSAEADSITRPLADAQKALFDKILNDASVDPLDVSYVEMHGTGTRTGDPIEMESVIDTCAPASSRPSARPLYVGAVKANVGHGEGAAGATSLAKVLLMMQHNIIPPHAGLRTTLNDSFPADMSERNVRVARQPIEWTREHDGTGTPRRVLINNFSAAGGNSALLLEDAPQASLGSIIQGTADLRSTHIVTVSAKTAGSLRANVDALLAFLRSDSFLSMSSGRPTLPALSYTTTARRAHHPYRLAIRGTNIQQIQAELQAALSRDDSSIPRSSSVTKPRVSFAFTGNGAQYIGMGAQLMASMPSFHNQIARLDRLVQSQGFGSILPMFTSTTGASISELDPVTTQVGTVSLQLALTHLWKSWGLRPSSVAGHSLGLYAALVAAGVLSEADALFIVGRRAQLLQKHCPAGTHAMLVVRGADQAMVDRVVDGPWQTELACINGPKDVVLAGAIDHLQHVSNLFQGKGATTTMLKVPYAFHSAQMDPILDEFEAACQGATFHKPTIPVICPLLATVITEADVISPHYLRRHCREPVDMLGALRSARTVDVLSDGGVAIEIGPQPAVNTMIKSTLGPTAITTLASLKRHQDVFAVLTQSLCCLYNMGFNIDWREYHSDFPAAHQVIQLPAYQWDLKNYWIQYVHDWSLRKGDPVPCSLEGPVLAELPQSMPSRRVVPPLDGLLIHRVVEDAFDDKMGIVIVETNLMRPDTRPLVQGHRVTDIPLATPAIYSNIALRIGTHIASRQALPPDEMFAVDSMAVERALVGHDGPAPQILRSTVMIDGVSEKVTCRFETIGDGTRTPRLHATCRLTKLSRNAALAGLQTRMVSPAVQRIEALAKEAGQARSVFRFSRSMTYRMVGALAAFDKDYRRVDEIVLDSKSMDASSLVSCTGLGAATDTHPAVLDGLAQSAGFIMNAHEGADLETEVHVNHGWTSFQLFERLDAAKTYRTYCKMSEVPEKRLWEGDCIVLESDSDRIVAWFAGITLQGVPRRALQLILSGESKSSSSTQPARPGPKISQPHQNTATFNKVPSDHTEKLSHSTRVSAVPIHTTQLSSVDDSSEEAEDAPFCDVELERSIEITLEPSAAFMTRQKASQTGSNSTIVIDSEDIASRALRIISEESGVGREELCDNVVFAELGIDSLLSLMVTARLRDELALEGDDLPDISLFAGGPTVGDLKRHLGPSKTSITSSPVLEPVTDSSAFKCVPVRPASSVILHGRPLSDSRTLWLFPDGSGNAVSYAAMSPYIRAGLAVIGLNCPYHRHPDDLAAGQIPLTGLIDAYLTEVRRRQPTGPYHLGGWSSGGILAFAATQRLIREGERVDTLVLIDAPPPTGLDPLPDRWYAHCQAANVFGGDGSDHDSGGRSLLFAHFRAQVKMLQHYLADPLPEGLTPRTSIVWAGRCTFDGRPGRPVFEMRPGDPQGIAFLTKQRTDWAAGKWAPLFPFDEPVVSVMEDCDHFSMMQKANGEQLARFVSDAVF